MTSCDLCGTTEENSYYSPMNRGGVTLCCKCDALWLVARYYGIGFIDNKKEVLKDLLKVVVRVKKESTFNIESLDRIIGANSEYFEDILDLSCLEEVKVPTLSLTSDD